MFNKVLMSSVAILALGVVSASAETVITKHTTTTTTSPVVSTTVTTSGGVDVPVEGVAIKKTTTVTPAISPAGARVINFIEFDMNNDRILSTNEVGEMLFKIYDTDGNNVIDNLEFDRRAVLTVTPVEKEVVTTFDFDNDGRADRTEYTYESFIRDTQLTRFDENKDGLSAAEFTGKSFLEADIDRSKAIEPMEWRSNYIASLQARMQAKANVNQ